MKLPEVAERLRDIAEKIAADRPVEAAELTDLADQCRRRPSPARAPRTSTPMTEELVQEIREYADANPAMSQQEIANAFGVNHGRVSEALRGKRT